MNKLLLFAILAMAQTTSFSQTALTPEALIETSSTAVHYGQIDQGSHGKTELTVYNRGTAPLIISRCKGSCGCTVPVCTKKPIAPGDSSVIEVKYNTQKIGPINKSISIASNASNSAILILPVTGTVRKTEVIPLEKNDGPLTKQH